MTDTTLKECIDLRPELHEKQIRIAKKLAKKGHASTPCQPNKHHKNMCDGIGTRTAYEKGELYFVCARCGCVFSSEY